MQLRKRNRVWHALFIENGRRVERSTRCTDRKAAESVGKQWERDASDPDNATARRATLNDALLLLLNDRAEQVKAGRKAEATLGFYRQKAGHLVRVLGHDFPLSKLTARDVRGYISTRRAEPAVPGPADATDEQRAELRRVTEHTISKELIALRAALKLAVVERLWRGDPREVIPVAFSPGYKARKRWLPTAELQALLAKLSPDEAARVAFIVATGAEWSATTRALRLDVRRDAQGRACRVLVRGSKRETRWREVPIVYAWQSELVTYALENAQGAERLFSAWPSVQRSLLWACKRAGVERCSPNDLRRTFAQWMRRDGMPIELLAPAMGHASTKMLESVYGRFDPEALEARMRSVVCHTGATTFSETPADSADTADGGKVTLPQENRSETGGLCGARSHGQRIKSPATLWPKPGKKPRDTLLRRMTATPVPHDATAKRG